MFQLFVHPTPRRSVTSCLVSGRGIFRPLLNHICRQLPFIGYPLCLLNIFITALHTWRSSSLFSVWWFAQAWWWGTQWTGQAFLLKSIALVSVKIKGSSYPCSRLWRPIGLWGVKGPTFSRQSTHRWRWGGRPYAPAAIYPPGRFLVLISAKSWVDPRTIVQLEGLGQLKNPVASSGFEPVTFRLVA
jgi:hypothetical protein